MRTPLYNVQRDHGASFTTVGDWDLAVEYGGCIEEHAAVRERIGLMDRCARSRLVVTGKDRYKWLQGMVTNDVRPLENGVASVSACVLNATGHLLADLTVIRQGDALILDAAWQNRRKLYDLLQQYVITEDVEIVDQSEYLACLSLQGPAATESVARQHAGPHSTLDNADHSGEGGVDIYVKADEAPALWERMVAAGITPVGEAAADTLRIEAGIPVYGVDMDETTIPLECSLEASHVCHDKGCYVGQEIIARIHSRGHTNRALTGFLVDHASLPAHGEKIFPVDGDATSQIGWVTSSTHSPSLKRSIALGYVRHEFRALGTHLRTSEAVTLRVSDLPFVRKDM